MNSLFLLQFACFIFMLVNAFIVALSHLHVRWENKRYERSRWMIVVALIGLAIQYAVQMVFGFRAMHDNLGAVINILIYTPCFSLISMGIYNIETTSSNLRKMILMCSGIYAAIIVVFCVGISLHHSLYIREGLYLMLSLCCVSVIILWLAVLAMPVAIFSTTLLYIVGPAVLLALLFFNLTFIALGSSYIPTEELLDKEENIQRCGGANGEKPLQQLSEERRNFIQNSLDQWCMDLGYKDCNVNMLTLSYTLCISKNELSLFFDQCLHSNFRIWLSEIRLNAAKKMMLEYPDYSNDIISAECGFSCRTHLYRIFKTKEGCSPTEWRDFQSTYAAQNDSNGA